MNFMLVWRYPGWALFILEIFRAALSSGCFECSEITGRTVPQSDPVAMRQSDGLEVAIQIGRK